LRTDQVSERSGTASCFRPTRDSAIVSTGAKAPEIQNNDGMDRLEGGVIRHVSTREKTHILQG
jgi:hypothetical protein